MDDHEAAQRHLVVGDCSDKDTTDYAACREPEDLFVANAAYVGSEVRRRIRAWMAANLDGRIIE